MAYIEIISVN